MSWIQDRWIIVYLPRRNLGIPPTESHHLYRPWREGIREEDDPIGRGGLKNNTVFQPTIFPLSYRTLCLVAEHICEVAEENQNKRVGSQPDYNRHTAHGSAKPSTVEPGVQAAARLLSQ